MIIKNTRQKILKALVLSLPFGATQLTPFPYTSLSFVLIYLYLLISVVSFRSSFSLQLFRRYTIWLFAMWMVMFAVTTLNSDPNSEESDSLLRQIAFFSVFLTFALKDVRDMATRNDGLERYLIFAIFLLIMAFYGGFSEVIEKSDRATLENLNPNVFATLCGVGFLLLLDSIMPHSGPTSIIRLPVPFILSGLAILAVSIALSGSRGGLIILVASVAVYFVATVRMTQRRLVLSVVFGLFSLMLLLFIVESPVMRERFVYIESDARLDDIWPIGLDIIRNNPFLGVGFAKSEVARTGMLRRYVGWHNTYLTVFTASGLAGFSLFVAFLLRLFRNAWAWRQWYNSTVQVSLFTLLLLLQSMGDGLFIVGTWLLYLVLSVHPADLSQRQQYN